MSKNRVLHISTECYPVAKEGGMADVVGALPKYLENCGWSPSVITPRYKLPWYDKHKFETIYSDTINLEGNSISFEVQKVEDEALKFDYYCVDIPGLFDRNSIYLNEYGHGFGDEAERNISFQRSVLQWLNSLKKVNTFQLLHCHDHQVGFIPFLIKKVEAFKGISKIPCFYTIHNGAYNSRYPWSRLDLLPPFDMSLSQLIDWDGQMDAVASAMRFSDYVNTVSDSYLEEMKAHMPALQFMSDKEPDKFSGILNGIDEVVWDPKTDILLDHKLSSTVEKFKMANKNDLLAGLYQLKGIPLISFIGRFAHQKGGDLLVPAIERILARFGFVNFFILGSGDRFIEHQVQALRDNFSERVGCYIGYNEALAHKIYAASDFIAMPSRFEPCGLNQMFAMRYGSLVIARRTGGLKDTVVDFEDGGEGISFDYPSIDDLTNAFARALMLYRDQKNYKMLRTKAMKNNFSWTNSAKEYCTIYNQLIEKT